MFVPYEIDASDPVAVKLMGAIRTGDTADLDRRLAARPELAAVGIVAGGVVRSLLHIVTDWPGHFPNGPATVHRLIDAGCDVDARVRGADHAETPLHWAASSNDIAVLDALIDHDATIDADNGTIAGATPLADAVAFGQWAAAHRLVERGATVELREAAALGQLDTVVDRCGTAVTSETLDQAFWHGCHGDQMHVAQYLHARGATLDRPSTRDGLTPLEAAERTNPMGETAQWLRIISAESSTDT